MIARYPINIRSWHTVIQYPNQSFKDLFYESEEIYSKFGEQTTNHNCNFNFF